MCVACGIETTLFIAWGTFGFVIKCAGTSDLIGGTAVILLHHSHHKWPQGNATRAVPAIGLRGLPAPLRDPNRLGFQ